MILVIVSIISRALLAGNSPHAVSVLVVNNRIRSSKTRTALFQDMYDSELYPVAMWDEDSANVNGYRTPPYGYHRKVSSGVLLRRLLKFKGGAGQLSPSSRGY